MKKMFIRLIFCDFNMATEHTVMTICGTIEKLCFVERYVKISITSRVPFELKVHNLNVWDIDFNIIWQLS